MISKLYSYHNLNFTYRLDEFTNMYAVRSWTDFHDAIFHADTADPKIKRYIDLHKKSPMLPVVPAVKYLFKFIGYILVGCIHKTVFVLAKISSFLLNVFGKSYREDLKQQKLANPNSWYKLKLCLLILINIITFIPFKSVGIVLKALAVIMMPA